MAESLDLATLHITVTTREVKEGISSLDGLSASAGKAELNVKKLSSAADSFASFASRVVVQVMALVGAYKALDAATNFVRTGFAFNANMETSRIGVASVVSATSDLIDAQGRILRGQEAYNAALKVSDQIMNRVRIMGLETTATTQDLVAGFQSMIGPATAVGFTMEQTQDFTLNMVKALGAMGIPLNQLSAEGRSLLDGTIIPTQDRLAIALGITGDMVKKWREQGVLAEELQKKLGPFASAGQDVANTWQGLSSNMKDALAVLSGFAGNGFFTGIKEAYKDIMNSIVDVKNARPGEDIENITNAVKRLLDYLGGKVQRAASNFLEWLEELNRPENLNVLEERVKGIGEALEAGVGMASKALGHVSSIIGSAMDGWNSVPENIRAVGLIGGMLFGLKGMAVAAAIGFIIDKARALNRGEVNDLLESSGMGGLSPSSAMPLVASHTPPALAASHVAYTIPLSQYSNDANAVRMIDLRVGEDRVTVAKSTLSDLAAAENSYTQLMKNSAQERTKAIANNFNEAIAKQKAALEASKKNSASALLYASSDEERKGINDALDVSVTAINNKIRALENERDKQLSAVTNKVSTSAKQAVNATADVYKDIAVLEAELQSIDSATRADGTINKQQLSLLQAKAAAEREYTVAKNNGVNEELAVRRMQLQIQVAEKKQIEDNIQVQQSFYQQFGQMFKDRTDLALRSLEKEEEVFRNAKVAEVDIEAWKQRKILELRRDGAAGVQRGLQRYLDEAQDAAKQTEQISYDMAKGFENNMTSAFDSMLETGQIKFGSLKSMFSGLLSDMFRMAVAKPITVQLVAAVTGAGVAGAAGSAAAGTAAAGSAGVGDIAGSMPWGSLMSDTGAGNTISGWVDDTAAWLMPETFGTAATAGGTYMVGALGANSTALASSLGAGSASMLGNVSYLGGTAASGTYMTGALGASSSAMADSLASSGTSYLASSAAPSFSAAATSPWTLGGGLVGSLGANAVNNALGWTSSESQIGSTIGSTAGTLGAAAIYASIAAANGWNPLGWGMAAAAAIGALLGGTGGGGIGSLFGSTEDMTPRGNIWSFADIGDGYQGFLDKFGSLGKKGFSTSGWETKIKESVKGVWETYDTAMGVLPLAIREGVDKQIADVQVVLHTNKRNQGESLNAKYWNDENFNGWIKSYTEEIYDATGEALMGQDLSALLPENMRPESIAGSIKKSLELLNFAKNMSADAQAGYVTGLGQNILNTYGGAGVDLSTVLANPEILKWADSSVVSTITAALDVADQLYTAADALRHPVNDIAAKAEAAQKQLDEYAKALNNAGLAESYAKDALEEYQQATIESYTRSFDELASPMSTFEQQMSSVSDAVTGHANALRIMGATTEQVMRIERQREQILLQTYDTLTREYRQTYAQRYAALTGGDTDALAAQIKYANELAQIEATYGKGENYTVTMLEKVAQLNRDAEQGRTDWTIAALDQAIADAGLTRETWYEQYGKAEGVSGPQNQYGETLNLQKAEEAKRVLTALQAQRDSLLQQEKSLLQEQLSAASTLVSAWESVVGTLTDSRYRMHVADSTGLGLQAQVLTAQAEFDRLYAATMAGDEDAAAQLGSVGQELLELRKQSSASSAEYLDAFYGVDRKLLDAGDYAARQLRQQQSQEDLLKSQIGVSSMTNDLLAQQTASVLAQIAAAESTLAAALGQVGKPSYTGGTSTSTGAGTGAGTGTITNANGTVSSGQGNIVLGNGTGAGASSGWLSDWEILQAKADALNAGSTLAPGQTAGGPTGGGPTGGGWTAPSVSQAIKDAGLTLGQWLDQYGKAEGFGGAVGIYGSRYQTELALLTAKASEMNMGNTLAPGQTAGGWTASNVRSAITDGGLTVQAWYERYGKAEGFATGGITPANRPFWVGENGPELMMSPYQYGVMNATDSAALANLARMPAVGGDGGLAAQNAMLKQELQEMRLIIREMLRKTDNIASTNEKMLQVVRKWDGDGLPEARA